VPAELPKKEPSALPPPLLLLLLLPPPPLPLARAARSSGATGAPAQHAAMLATRRIVAALRAVTSGKSTSTHSAGMPAPVAVTGGGCVLSAGSQ